MELTATLDIEALDVGPALVRRVVDEAAGLERVLARRETQLGQAIERDLFPDGAPERVMPADVRRALSARLERAIGGFVGAGFARSPDDVAAPLRAIAASVRTSDSDDTILDLLFPAGVPARVTAEELLRAFRAAASRELRALVRLASLAPPDSWDTLMQHEISGRLVVTMRLWVVCLRWYALAAGRMGPTQARSFHALLEKWQTLEKTTRISMIDA